MCSRNVLTSNHGGISQLLHTGIKSCHQTHFLNKEQLQKAKMDRTGLGDRMKEYEKMYSLKLIATLPIIARLDGRAFSKFTKGLKKPYDETMSKLMQDTCKFLVDKTDANCGYTQSDEITLGWYYPDYKSQMFFDGKIGKLNSVLAAMASVKFNSLISELDSLFWKRKLYMMPTFDCRVFNLPSVIEGANAFLWREQDATRNSVSSAAHSIYSTKELYKKNRTIMLDMLIEKGINWNDYPSFFKRGSYFKKETVQRKFTKEELGNLPEKHIAREDPDTLIIRSLIVEQKWNPLSQYPIEDRCDMIFGVGKHEK